MGDGWWAMRDEWWVMSDIRVKEWHQRVTLLDNDTWEWHKRVLIERDTREWHMSERTHIPWTYVQTPTIKFQADIALELYLS